MLTELLIRDVGVIDEVTLELGPGLNVLTGETGAGKTMVVSALELLLGARADADRVRAGASAAVVEGRIAPPPAAAADWLDGDDDELVVSRQVAAHAPAGGASGRSRARIGGRLAPASALADCVRATVELHGQHDTARLGRADVQRELLDRVGGPALADAASEYRTAYRRWRSAADELAALRDSDRERAREVDRLRFELDEIAEVGVDVGEEATLLSALARLEHVEQLATAAAAGAEALTADAGARDTLGIATAALRAAAGVDPALDALAERVAALAAEVQEAGFDLAGYRNGLEADPAELERLREREAGLVRLTRKYGDGTAVGAGVMDSEAIAVYAERSRARLTELEGAEGRAAGLVAEVDELAAALAVAGATLHEERRAAGARLADTVGAHLADLAMPGARLTVEVAAAEPGENGADRVAFLLAANQGEAALPLAKAASGGERSRIALALRLALATADDTPVLVFDEIDAGIGGATALEVGRKLAQLAAGRQVLCVTHLAQLAAYADVHFAVEKAASGTRAVASVTALTEEQRVRELSRMLSGTPDSARAGDHAAELRERALGETAKARERRRQRG